MTPPLPTDDIQAVVASGFGDLDRGEYLLLTLQGGAAAARRWIASVLPLVPNASEVGRTAIRPLQEVVALAFSHAGLLALGLEPSPERAFPSIFVDGMGHPQRAEQLGDDDIDQWRWTDRPPARDGAAAVHVFVTHHWSGAAAPSRASLFDAVQLAAAGFRWQRVLADPRHMQSARASEPFGFRDGLAQPVIEGLSASAEQALADADAVSAAVLRRNRIAAGEFLLGQRNEYGDLAYAPDVHGWPGPQTFAHNGSYVAVRQIVQDVQALADFEALHGPGVVEKMVGRRRDGTPLCPHDPGDSETFGYRVADERGFGCPRGAHVRRANPRDSLGSSADTASTASRLHRLLRRGRAYREADGKTADEVGLFFVALNADLDRQFAFVQQRWIANPRFGGLADEADPLLGRSHRAFTLQHPVLGTRITAIPRFTRVVGGGYFLLPGIAALRHIAAAAASGVAPALASAA